MKLDTYKRAGYDLLELGRVARFMLSGVGEYVSFSCPGCGEEHTLPITGSRAWGFNGDVHNPTLTPSILCRYHAYNEDTEQYDQLESVCHSFVRNGQIEFLGDCTHALRGQTVPLSEIEGAE